MRLVTYRKGKDTSIAVVIGDWVIDLPSCNSALPANMLDFLRAGPGARKTAAAVKPTDGKRYPLKSVELLAPIPNPGKFLAIGMNYRKHVEEAQALGFQMPKTQVWFNKQVSCVNSPHGDVVMPRVSEQLDYEVELAVVIGKQCRFVSVTDAPSVIAGYMICNDVSVRDWQMASPTMTMGKSFDTHGPIGPWLVTADEIPDPHALSMRLLVNGELRQEDSTSAMVANIYQQIEHLSTAFTLEPGDILATGTPSGVAVAMKPPRYLRVGDICRAEIEKIGFIENRIVAEAL